MGYLKTLYFIHKKTNFPIGIMGENYSTHNTGEKLFISQRYYDIQINLEIREDVPFNTSMESIKGFVFHIIKPE
ncbi:MAG: hypothetical protein JEZ03_05440 [Bacteroidales bacterium]|nr:hypothetical protein [Bacteroidales bacterium]